MMNITILFEAIDEARKSSATLVGAGYDAIKGSLELGTAAGFGYNAMQKLFDKWKEKYFIKGNYEKSTADLNPWWSDNNATDPFDTAKNSTTNYYTTNYF